jgi:hypothetical protein
MLLTFCRLDFADIKGRRVRVELSFAGDGYNLLAVVNDRTVYNGYALGYPAYKGPEMPLFDFHNQKLLVDAIINDYELSGG